MVIIKAYPANKRFFIRLKAFCREVVDICENLGVTVVAHGSLAYFAYTKDKNININDIDFLIPEDSFEKMAKILTERRIKHRHIAKWHTLHVFENNLRIEFDSIDYWYSGPKNFKNFDFDGLTVKVVSLDGIKGLYKKASKLSKDKPDEYRKKFDMLKKLE